MPIFSPTILRHFCNITNEIISDSVFNRTIDFLNRQLIFAKDLAQLDLDSLELQTRNWKDYNPNLLPIIFNHTLWILDPSYTFRYLPSARKSIYCPICQKSYVSIKQARRHIIEARCVVITVYQNLPTKRRIEKLRRYEMLKETRFDSIS